MKKISTVILLGVVAAMPALGQDFDAVEIRTTDLGGGIYMLQGAGGNLGLSVGADGVFLIDDDYAPLAEKIRDAIAAVSDQPVGFLINTHWHGDHAGGNEQFGGAGAACRVAHRNLRRFDHRASERT
jgi:cyclase